MTVKIVTADGTQEAVEQAQAVSESEIVVIVRNFNSIQESIDDVNSSSSYIEVDSPFERGLIKRVVMYKPDDNDTSNTASLIISTSDTVTPVNKVVEYAGIDFTEAYLDELEDIYYVTDSSKLYFHCTIAAENDTTLTIRVDVEKVS